MYFHCFDGQAWPQRCPTGYFFSPKMDFQNCVSKFCVPWYEADCPIDGQWSSWSEWSECETVSSELGIRRRTRECNSPPPINGGNDCEGESSQTEICKLEDNSKSYFFGVSLNRPQNLNEERVNWTKVNLNENNLFDTETNSLNITKNGFYFISFSGTFNQTKSFSLSLRNTGRNVGILGLPKSNISKVTLTRESLFLLSSIFRPHVYQNIKSNVELIGSEHNEETSWNGFYYDTNQYFFASRSDPFKRFGSVNLPNVVRVGFTISGNGFRSTSPGIFYVSYGIGIPENITTVRASILREELPHRNIFASNPFNEIDSVVKNYILNSFSDTAFFELRCNEGEFYSDEIHQQTYMLAFKLNESNPIFYVRRNTEDTSYSFSKIKFFSGGVGFDNFGGWNLTENEYKIPKNGIYYISFNIPVLQIDDFVTEIVLRVNEKNRLRMLADTKYENSSKLVIKTGIFRLSLGDKISLYFKGKLADDRNEGVFNIFQIN